MNSHGYAGRCCTASSTRKEALRVAPQFALAHVKIGILHESNQQSEEAERACLAAIDLDPKQMIAYNNLAWMAAERRVHLDEALTWAKKAVALAPTVPQLCDTLGWVHRARGELDHAATVLHKATTLPPPQAVIRYHLGLVQAERKQTQEAVAAFKQALTFQQDFGGVNDTRRRLAELEKKS